jgi:hypothetical protein
MSTTNNTIRHAVIALHIPTRSSDFVTFARNVVKSMTANPLFPTPVPSLVTVTTATDDLAAAETATLSRTKGAVATRNEKRAALVLLVKQLGHYVQTVADASPDGGASVIASAGFAARKAPTRRARAFEAKPGAVSGTASLVAVTPSRRASYEWQSSTDGGKTWVLAPVTLQAKTTIAGLVPGATVLFRYRPVTKAGEGDWSQAVSLVIA